MMVKMDKRNITNLEDLEKLDDLWIRVVTVVIKAEC